MKPFRQRGCYIIIHFKDHFIHTYSNIDLIEILLKILFLSLCSEKPDGKWEWFIFIGRCWVYQPYESSYICTTIWLENRTSNYKLVSIYCFRKDSIVIFETKKSSKKEKHYKSTKSVAAQNLAKNAYNRFLMI